MSENGNFDEFIKRQFNNSSPEVPSRVWENIMAAREKRKPKAFWWNNLADSKNILAGLAILIACCSITWITWMMVHSNNSAKNALASSSLDKKNEVAVLSKATTTNSNSSDIEKQNYLPASSLAATGNNVSPSAPSSFNNSSSNGTNSTTTIGSANATRVTNHFIRWRVNKIRSRIKQNHSIGNNDENQTSLVNNEATSVVSGKDNDQTVADSSELSSLSSSSVPPVLAFISGVGDGVKRSKAWHLPECPTVEKAPSRERDYIQFYAGPDYGIRTLSDPGNLQYVKARDSSSHFTSGFSFGASYTKVFKNGLSLREGLNYSQINEWFTAAKNNSFTVYSIDQAGDTLGKTITYKVTHNHYSTLDIPLTIGYEFALDKDSRFVANVNAGAIINIFSWQNGDVLDTANNTVHITTSSANYSPYLFKTVMGVGFVSNISVYYKVSDYFSVVAEPYFRYNFQPMTQNTSSFSEKYTTIGLHVGVHFDLH